MSETTPNNDRMDESSLAGMEGDEKSLDAEHHGLIVKVDVLGLGTHITPTELDFSQVQRVP
jgi:transcription antitermination factor NusG